MNLRFLYYNQCVIKRGVNKIVWFLRYIIFLRSKCKVVLKWFCCVNRVDVKRNFFLVTYEEYHVQKIYACFEIVNRIEF